MKTVRGDELQEVAEENISEEELPEVQEEDVNVNTALIC